LEVLKAGDKIAETYAFEPDISYDTTTYKKWNQTIVSHT
jgi:hypothetical protein